MITLIAMAGYCTKTTDQLITTAKYPGWKPLIILGGPVSLEEQLGSSERQT